MYAIVAHGNQQYKVEPDQVLEIDFFEADPGAEFIFDRVLAVSNDQGFRFGAPTISGAKVKAQIIGATQGPKLYIQKMRRRKNYRRRTGHRQKFVKVKVLSIAG